MLLTVISVCQDSGSLHHRGDHVKFALGSSPFLRQTFHYRMIRLILCNSNIIGNMGPVSLRNHSQHFVPTFVLWFSFNIRVIGVHCTVHGNHRHSALMYRYNFVDKFRVILSGKAEIIKYKIISLGPVISTQQSLHSSRVHFIEDFPFNIYSLTDFFSNYIFLGGVIMMPPTRNKQSF